MQNKNTKLERLNLQQKLEAERPREVGFRSLQKVQVDRQVLVA